MSPQAARSLPGRRLRHWPRSTKSPSRTSSVKYQVRLTAKAEGDVERILGWFQEQSASAAGARWMVQLMARIATLESHPERCALTVEADGLGVEIRELSIGKRRGKHRLLFQIQGRTVFILRVWHSTRDAISRDDL